MRLVWTRPAARDLEFDRRLHFPGKSTAAERAVNRISDAAANLADFPRLGRQGRVADTRELVISSTPFIVVYRIRKDRVEILAVYHSARRWPESFDVLR